MPSSAPALGSLAIQVPAPTHTVHVSPTTCHDLSLFKDLMREYRKLDDSITMRLNRTVAQFRDLDRTGVAGKGSVQDQACLQIWRELVDNWTRRTKIIDYCVGVLDSSKKDTQTSIDNLEDDPRSQRKLRAALYADDTKRNQIHNELTVEKIVRHRSAEAFRSRCKFFDPPSSDINARQIWEVAETARL